MKRKNSKDVIELNLRHEVEELEVAVKVKEVVYCIECP